MRKPLSQSQLAQNARGFPFGVVLRLRRNELRDHDVFKRAELGKKVMSLVNKADAVAAQPRALAVGKRRSR